MFLPVHLLSLPLNHLLNEKQKPSPPKYLTFTTNMHLSSAFQSFVAVFFFKVLIERPKWVRLAQTIYFLFCVFCIYPSFSLRGNTGQKSSSLDSNLILNAAKCPEASHDSSFLILKWELGITEPTPWVVCLAQCLVYSNRSVNVT